VAEMGGSGSEFSFSDEQQALRTAVRKFCAENFGEEAARRHMEADVRYDRAVWRRLGTELGVLGMAVPEADGGVGGSLVDQAVAVEEFGATLACGPLFGTVYLAIPALVACPPGAARDQLLGELVEGERTAAVGDVRVHVPVIRVALAEPLVRGVFRVTELPELDDGLQRRAEHVAELVRVHESTASIHRPQLTSHCRSPVLGELGRLCPYAGGSPAFARNCWM